MTEWRPAQLGLPHAPAGHGQRLLPSPSADFAGFGLAGLRGFFDKIYVGLDGYLQVVELEPAS
jgi:hypothetical protein